MDQDDLAGPEQPLADSERADLVVRDDAARVADDVSLALREPENPVDVEPGVHASDHGHALGRGKGQWALERRSVAFVVGEQFVSNGHRQSSFEWCGS
jgi:hypothetical protein